VRELGGGKSNVAFFYRIAQGHQGAPALRQNRHAPASPRRGGAPTAQASEECGSAARVRHPAGERGTATRTEGRTITHGTNAFAASHRAAAAAAEARKEIGTACSKGRWLSFQESDNEQIRRYVVSSDK
jgi:hypothetical protein